MINLLNLRCIKPTQIIKLLMVIGVLLLVSCKKDYNCICTRYDSITLQPKEVNYGIIHDTKKKSQKKCSEIWCGDECGCSIK